MLRPSFAQNAGYVYLVELENEGISLNGRNLLVFDGSLQWDINRIKGVGMLGGSGLFNTTVGGTGTVAVTSVGKPVVFDCSQQPVYVDPNSAVLLVGDADSRRTQLDEHGIDAARRLRRGRPVRLPRRGLRGGAGLRVENPRSDSQGGGILGTAADLLADPALDRLSGRTPPPRRRGDPPPRHWEQTTRGCAGERCGRWCSSPWSAPASCCPCSSRATRCRRSSPAWSSTASTSRSSRPSATTRPGYQGYDKAMDVFYLAIAYLATLRNWLSLPAFRVGRFLYFYRLVGVVAFELTQVRALLLVFPNTFEYFFIAYEAVRSRWSPLRFPLGWWVVGGRGDLGLREAAAGVLDPRRPARRHRHPRRDTPGPAPLLVGLILVLAAVFWFVVRPAAARAGLGLAVRRRPAARGDGHRRRAVRLARAVGAHPVLGDPGEGGPGRADRRDLRPDAAGRPLDHARAVHRCRRGGRGQRGLHPGPGSPRRSTHRRWRWRFLARMVANVAIVSSPTGCCDREGGDLDVVRRCSSCA